MKCDCGEKSFMFLTPSDLEDPWPICSDCLVKLTIEMRQAEIEIAEGHTVSLEEVMNDYKASSGRSPKLD